MNLNFKQKLARGDLLVGSIITMPAPEISEIICEAGFDWLFIDLEHSVMGVKEAQVLLQAASPNTACLVRVPAIDEVWIKKVLDIGPAGIIIPQVKTAEQVARVVQLCKYPPQGVRSVGIARAHGYGQKFQEYVAASRFGSRQRFNRLLLPQAKARGLFIYHRLVIFPGSGEAFNSGLNLKERQLGRAWNLGHSPLEEAKAFKRNNV